MGNNCTRNCRYCNITCAKPEILDTEEPEHVAEAVQALGLKYAVITSVTRDDLPDGGAQHFANCIYEIRKISPDVKVEILTPDFKGNKNSLDTIIKAHPDVLIIILKLYEVFLKLQDHRAIMTVLWMF